MRFRPCLGDDISVSVAQSNFASSSVDRLSIFPILRDVFRWGDDVGDGVWGISSESEYRFSVSYGPAFSRLRNEVYDRGYDALFTAERDAKLFFPREIRADEMAFNFRFRLMMR